MRKACSQVVNDLNDREIHLHIAHHSFSIHLIDQTDSRYLGMVCHFNKCPKHKFECRVPGCGANRFVQILPWFQLKPQRLNEFNSQVLFQRRHEAASAIRGESSGVEMRVLSARMPAWPCPAPKPHQRDFPQSSRKRANRSPPWDGYPKISSPVFPFLKNGTGQTTLATGQWQGFKGLHVKLSMRWHDDSPGNQFGSGIVQRTRADALQNSQRYLQSVTTTVFPPLTNSK